MWASLVSVPRRGFIVFLRGTDYYGGGQSNTFQSPEGDSLFFYVGSSVDMWAEAVHEFQSPEGDSLFFYSMKCHPRSPLPSSFSPPKGIHCFSTETYRKIANELERFQSPEGDSLFFYAIKAIRRRMDC